MTIIVNATLTGGVAVGTGSDIITTPSGSLWVGFIAGIFSAIGFNIISPILGNKIDLQDTCGVLSANIMAALRMSMGDLGLDTAA